MARKRLISRSAAYAVAHPWRVIVAWALLVGAMSVAGLSVKEVLKPGNVLVSGTESSEATKLEREKFGNAETIAIMLRGPKFVVDRYGRRATKTVKGFEGAAVISPWTYGAPQGLRKESGEALFIVQLKQSLMQVGAEIAPKMRSALEWLLPSSISVHMLGTSILGYTVVKKNIDDTQKAEVIAAPFLLMILLLIFRSPVAAALCLLLGFSVIQIGTGILTLMARIVHVDVVALSAVSMLGLALGVDYSLLVVTRFRDELKRRSSVKEAVSASMSTAGATVVVAGLTVTIGLGLMALVMPGSKLVTTALGAMLAALVSVVAALTILPAVLAILGWRINKWSLRAGRSPQRVSALVTRLIKRPAIVSVVLIVPLLALTVPALGLKTGPPDGRVLPADSRTLRDGWLFMDTYGMGWAAPFEVVVASKKGPLTDQKNLTGLKQLQAELARDPDVALAFGPAKIATASAGLSRAVEQGQDKLDRFSHGLNQAEGGVSELRKGLAQASSGSGTLSSGLGDAFGGSSQLQNGLQRAYSGTQVLESGISQISSGSSELSSAIAGVSAGSGRLRAAASTARAGADSLSGPAAAFKAELERSKGQIASLKGPPTEAIDALQEAKSSLDALPLAIKSEPNFQAAYAKLLTADSQLSGYHPISGEQLAPNYYGVTSALDRAQAELAGAASAADELAAGGDELASGLGRLQAGNQRLYSATQKTLTGAKRLDSALTRAASGASDLAGGSGQLLGGSSRLTNGISQLQVGAGKLKSGLSDGHMRSGGLEYGLGSMADELDSTKAKLYGSGDKESSKGSIDPEKVAQSGYTTLAALDGLDTESRQSANFVVSLDRGAEAARIFVVSKGAPTDAHPLIARLRAQADNYEKSSGNRAYMGGAGAMLDDYDRVTERRKLLVILALSLVTFIFLIVAFRSLLIAFKAVLLNLLVVGSAFGIVALLFNGPNPPLGGPGFMDAIVFFICYGVVFTLSMDYEVFMINRMREGYRETGSTDKAITSGVRQTAAVVTGAAAIMAAVFLTFSVVGFNVIRQVGVALTAAVVLDAIIVRLVLLPATMRLFGRANWWLPKWLERRLPRVDYQL